MPVATAAAMTPRIASDRMAKGKTNPTAVTSSVPPFVQSHTMVFPRTSPAVFRSMGPGSTIVSCRENPSPTEEGSDARSSYRSLSRPAFAAVKLMRFLEPPTSLMFLKSRAITMKLRVSVLPSSTMRKPPLTASLRISGSASASCFSTRIFAR